MKLNHIYMPEFSSNVVNTNDSSVLINIYEWGEIEFEVDCDEGGNTYFSLTLDNLRELIEFTKKLQENYKRK